jgi:PadR family transcriptional regulator, regulatory protein PadR
MSTREQKERVELLQGTLDLLVLRTPGSLYPALHRVIKRGWISVEEGALEKNRRAKFYRLTAKGGRPLAVETGKWDKLAGAIARILRPIEEGES